MGNLFCVILSEAKDLARQRVRSSTPINYANASALSY